MQRHTLVIQMDVQGWEDRALMGAIQTIARFKVLCPANFTLPFSSQSCLPLLAACSFLRGGVLLFCRPSPVLVSFRRAVPATLRLPLQVMVPLHMKSMLMPTLNLHLLSFAHQQRQLCHHQQQPSSAIVQPRIASIASLVCHLPLPFASDGASFPYSTPKTTTILNR